MSLFLDHRELLDAFRRGDRRALGEVYVHYGSAVYGILKHGFSFQSQGKWQRFAGCRNEHDAEEMMQEVFRKAFEERARMAYDGLRPYKTYLFTIARNHVIDELRRARNRLEVLATDDQQPEPGQDLIENDPAPNPEQDASDKELHQLVSGFRAKLEELEGKIFDLRFGEEQEQEQTAEHLGLSVYKVRKIERQLRKRLLVQLKKHGYLSDRDSAATMNVLLGFLSL